MHNYKVDYIQNNRIHFYDINFIPLNTVILLNSPESIFFFSECGSMFNFQVLVFYRQFGGWLWKPQQLIKPSQMDHMNPSQKPSKADALSPLPQVFLWSAGGRTLHVHILHTCTSLWSATASGHSLRALCATHTAANEDQPQVTFKMNPNNEFPSPPGILRESLYSGMAPVRQWLHSISRPNSSEFL